LQETLRSNNFTATAAFTWQHTSGWQVNIWVSTYEKCCLYEFSSDSEGDASQQELHASITVC